MAMTMREARAQMAQRPDRTPVLVHEDGAQFVATYGNEEFRAGNPFELDSTLTVAGIPAPRDLYLVEVSDA